jgi:hypothetical protein
VVGQASGSLIINGSLFLVTLQLITFDYVLVQLRCQDRSGFDLGRRLRAN